VSAAVPIHARGDAPTGHPSDEVLAIRARDGDRCAFDDLVRRHRRDVWAYATSILGDPDLADDVAQETFLRAWRTLGRFDVSRRFWPWIQTICHRVCLDEVRKRRRWDRRHVPIDDTIPMPDHAVGAVEGIVRRRALASALSTLSARHRTLFLQQVMDGWTCEELARADGSSPSAVAKALVRARTRVRIGLEPFRDLLAAIPPFAFVGSLKRHLRGWAARRTPLRGTQVEVVGERVLGLFLALSIAGVLAGGGDGGRPDASVDEGTVESSIQRTIEPGGGTIPMQPRGHRPHRSAQARDDFGVSVDGGLVAGYVQVDGPRRGGAAPREQRQGIEIRGPDGRVLLWHQQEHSCRRGVDSLRLPGPVRFVC